MMNTHNKGLKYSTLLCLGCVIICCSTKSLTKQIVTQAQSQSANSIVTNQPYGISMSKLFGEWKSIDSFNYRIEFINLHSDFVLHNIDTPFFHFQNDAYNIPSKSAPLVHFYFSNDSMDVVNSVGYYHSKPELYFLLKFISNDTLQIRYSQLQVEKTSILYVRKQK